MKKWYQWIPLLRPELREESRVVSWDKVDTSKVTLLKWADLVETYGVWFWFLRVIFVCIDDIFEVFEKFHSVLRKSSCVRNNYKNLEEIQKTNLQLEKKYIYAFRNHHERPCQSPKVLPRRKQQCSFSMFFLCGFTLNIEHFLIFWF